MDAVLDKSFKLTSNVEIGKFSALILDDGTYPDGCDIPGGANAGPLAGVAQESILPNSVADYAGGVYQIASGTAWPSNSIPSAAIGRAINCRMIGISRCIAKSAISVGDVVNIAEASTGKIKTVSEATGTLIHALGRALDAAGADGDVIRVMVMPWDYTAP